MTIKFGRDLKCGDCIMLLGHTYRVASLAPYVGTLAAAWEEDGGARIATLTGGPCVAVMVEPNVPFAVCL